MKFWMNAFMLSPALPIYFLDFFDGADLVERECFAQHSHKRAVPGKKDRVGRLILVPASSCDVQTDERSRRRPGRR